MCLMFPARGLALLSEAMGMRHSWVPALWLWFSESWGRRAGMTFLREPAQCSDRFLLRYERKIAGNRITRNRPM